MLCGQVTMYSNQMEAKVQRQLQNDAPAVAVDSLSHWGTLQKGRIPAVKVAWTQVSHLKVSPLTVIIASTVNPHQGRIRIGDQHEICN